MPNSNKIFIFSSYPDYKLDKRIVEVQTLNKKTLELNNDLRKVAEVDNFHYAYGNLEFKASPSGNRMLIYAKHPIKKQDGQKNTSGKQVFTVFEEDVKEVWSKEVKLPYEDKVFAVQSYSLDDQGRLLFLGALFEGKVSELEDKDIMGIGVYSFKKLVKDAESRNLSYKHILLTYNGNDLQTTQYEIKLKDKFICDIHLMMGENGDLICSGFYSKVGIKSIKGAFYLRYDGKSQTLKKENTKEFSMDFITYGLNDWQMKEVEKQGTKIEMYQYDLRHAVVMDDGSIYLVAEQNLNYGGGALSSYGAFEKRINGIYRFSGKSPAHPNGNYNYSNSARELFSSALLENKINCNDILITRIDPAGDIQWFDRISKRQAALTFYVSFGIASNENNLYILFNDHALNYNPKYKNKPYVFTGADGLNSILVIAKIEKDGKITKEQIISAKEANGILKPKNCVQILNDKVLINGDDGYKQQFNTVMLEKK